VGLAGIDDGLPVPGTGEPLASKMQKLTHTLWGLKNLKLSPVIV